MPQKVASMGWEWNGGVHHSSSSPTPHAGASEAVPSAKELEDTGVQSFKNEVDTREQADSLIAKLCSDTSDSNLQVPTPGC